MKMSQTLANGKVFEKNSWNYTVFVCSWNKTVKVKKTIGLW